MGLFDKKFCSVCGEKIGLLGNRKLEDGNLCKNCASRLSPFFDDRRHSTVEEIKKQLAYREENEKQLESFEVTRTFGEETLICLDEKQHKFVIATTNDIHSENPDIIDFSQVTNCELDIHSNRVEEKKADKEGKMVSYNPPRFRTDYEFDQKFRINSPWFDEIEVRLNKNTIRVYENVGSGIFFNSANSVYNNDTSGVECRKYETMGNDIKEAIMNNR